MWYGLAWRFLRESTRNRAGRASPFASPMASLTGCSPFCGIIPKYRETSPKTTSPKYIRCGAELTDEGTPSLQIKSRCLRDDERTESISQVPILRISPRYLPGVAFLRTGDSRITTLCVHANQEARLLQRLGELSTLMILSGFHGCEQAKARLKRAGQELVQTATLGC